MPTLVKLLSLALGIACATACADGNPEGPTPGDEAQPGGGLGEQSGSLTIKLAPGGDLTFSSFSYAIVRPGFAKSGSIDVSKSKTVSTTIAGLPPATGYSLTLMGQSSSPVEANCSGSTLFDVTAGHVTSAPVSIECHVNEVTPAPAQAPIPPLAPVALSVLLAAAGAARLKRRKRSSNS